MLILWCIAFYFVLHKFQIIESNLQYENEDTNRLAVLKEGETNFDNFLKKLNETKDESGTSFKENLETMIEKIIEEKMEMSNYSWKENNEEFKALEILHIENSKIQKQILKDNDQIRQTLEQLSKYHNIEPHTPTPLESNSTPGESSLASTTEVEVEETTEDPSISPHFANDSPKHIKVEVGSTAHIPWKIRNLGNYNVSWIRMRDVEVISVGLFVNITDDRFSVQRDNSTGDWTLSINQTDSIDSGNYECSISTIPVTTFSVQLEVFETSEISSTIESSLASTTEVEVEETSEINSIIKSTTASTTETEVEETSEVPSISPEGPHFASDNPKNIKVETGSTAHLPCKVRNLNSKSVSWMRISDKEIISVDLFVSISDDRFSVVKTPSTGDMILSIKDTDPSDSGNYECSINTKSVTTLSVQLQVSGQHFASDSPKHIKVEVRSTAYIPCKARNYGSKLVSWIRLRDSFVLTAGLYVVMLDPRYSIYIDSSTGDRILVIRNSKLSDSGYYECSISTGQEKDVHTVRLEVVEELTTPVEEAKDQIFASDSPKQIKALVGSIIRIPCKISYKGPATVFWMRTSDSHLLTIGYLTVTSDDRFSAERNYYGDRILVIRDPMPSDSSYYECSFAMESATAVHNVKLNVTDCSSFPDYRNYNDFGCLKVNRNKMSWEDARSSCISEGGDLFSPPDFKLPILPQDEMNLGNESYWIAIRRHGYGRAYRSVSETISDKTALFYTSALWYAGEPDYESAECAFYHGGNKLLCDDSCTYKYHFICHIIDLNTIY